MVNKGRKKKVRLKDRKLQIRNEINYINKRKRLTKLEEADAAEKKRKKLLKDARILYKADQRILLLGEGNFSFSRALVELFSDKPKDGLLVCTCFDSKEVLYEKYSDSKKNIKYIRKSGQNVKIMTKVNAMNLEKEQGRFKKELNVSDSQLFNRIVFNFPHLGDGEKNKDKSIKNHQELLLHAAHSCYKFLEPTGELHITTKLGEPYSKWRVGGTVQSTKLYKLKTAKPFIPSLYPGYEHRRTVGAAFKSESEGGPEANADITKLGAITFIFSPLLNK